MHHICETPMPIRGKILCYRRTSRRELELEELTAFDISYILRAPKLTARLTAYHTAITNASEISFFFAEGIGGDTSSFVQEISQNIDKDTKELSLVLKPMFFRHLPLKESWLGVIFTPTTRVSI